MKEIYDDIYADWGTGFEFQGDRLPSHLLFLRINEVFQSLMLLLENDFPVPAAILLRPLSEAYILLRASIEDPESEFNDRYIKKSAKQKEDWLKYIIQAYEKSAFTEDKAHYQNLLKKTSNSKSEEVDSLQQIPQLFRKFSEMDMYLHIYQSGNHYLHHDAQSLNVYFNKEREFIESEHRDYSAVYIHTAYGSIYVMLRAYAFHSEILGKKENQYERLFNKFVKHNNEIEALKG